MSAATKVRLREYEVVYDHGKLIALDTPSALIASLGAQQVVTMTLDQGVAVSWESLDGVDRGKQEGSQNDQVVLHVRDIQTALQSVMRVIRDHQRTLLHLETHQASLDDVFVHLTGRALRDA